MLTGQIDLKILCAKKNIKEFSICFVIVCVCLNLFLKNKYFTVHAMYGMLLSLKTGIISIFKGIVSFMVHLGYGGAGLSTFYVVSFKVQIPTITLESICLV